MVDFNQKIICLITDFGLKGQHYIASMKAVILNINPYVRIIDLSNHINPQSIIEASYVLKTTYKYFPEGTVFIIVVDPGVGSSREILALKTISNYYFIGPNNGIFTDFSSNQIAECREIQNELFFNKPISNTFHGRDIMAPIGAHLLSGIPLEKFGPAFSLDKLITLTNLYKIDINEKIISCSIQYVDSFGNGITNIPIINNKIQNCNLTVDEGMKIKVNVKGELFEGQFSSHYESVPIGSILFLVGSTGFLELSINQGNASKKLGFNVGDVIKLKI
ncbi:MAG: S-adenosyl-l-methionine hydroxide adenosyltransferase family protein [Candidatus Thorarchaeota archaeon]